MAVVLKLANFCCSIQENLIQYLGPLKDIVQKIYSLSYTEDASLCVAHWDGSNKHCTKFCVKYIPFKGADMKICGVATIMSAIVLTNDALFSYIMKNSLLPRSFSWLKAFKKYSLCGISKERSIYHCWSNLEGDRRALLFRILDNLFIYFFSFFSFLHYHWQFASIHSC